MQLTFVEPPNETPPGSQQVKTSCVLHTVADSPSTALVAMPTGVHIEIPYVIRIEVTAVLRRKTGSCV